LFCAQGRIYSDEITEDPVDKQGGAPINETSFARILLATACPGSPALWARSFTNVLGKKVAPALNLHLIRKGKVTKGTRDVEISKEAVILSVRGRPDAT
jgi:hypothetical protein